MAKCKNCNHLTVEIEKCLGVEVPFDWCEKKADNPYRNLQRDCPYFKPKTNADRIRSMTDEEIANFITNIRTKWIDEYEYVYVIKGKQLAEFEDVLNWLKSEVGCE